MKTSIATILVCCFSLMAEAGTYSILSEQVPAPQMAAEQGKCYQTISVPQTVTTMVPHTVTTMVETQIEVPCPVTSVQAVQTATQGCCCCQQTVTAAPSIQRTVTAAPVVQTVQHAQPSVQYTQSTVECAPYLQSVQYTQPSVQYTQSTVECAPYLQSVQPMQSVQVQQPILTPRVATYNPAQVCIDGQCTQVETPLRAQVQTRKLFRRAR